MTRLTFIFDLKGVLINHLKRQCEVATKALRNTGISYNVTPEHYRLRAENAFHSTGDFLTGMYVASKHNLSVKQLQSNPERVEEYVKKLSGIERDTILKVEKEFNRLRHHAKPGEIKAKEPPFRGVVKLVKRLRKEGHQVFVVTYGQMAFGKPAMIEAGLWQVVGKSNIVFGEDRIKKPTLFRDLIKSRGLNTKRTFVVEDSISGIDAATKNSLKAIGVLTGNTSKARYRAMKARGEEPPVRVLKIARELRGKFGPLSRATKRLRGRLK